MAAEYAKIVERIDRGNPPELQAKLDAVKGGARAMRTGLGARKARRATMRGILVMSPQPAARKALWG